MRPISATRGGTTAFPRDLSLCDLLGIPSATRPTLGSGSHVARPSLTHRSGCSFPRARLPPRSPVSARPCSPAWSAWAKAPEYFPAFRTVTFRPAFALPPTLPFLRSKPWSEVSARCLRMVCPATLLRWATIQTRSRLCGAATAQAGITNVLAA